MARQPRKAGAPHTARPPSGTFGPAWLATQLSALLPAFPNISLCVALSGGVDSTALLAALAALLNSATSRKPRSPTAAFRLRALHVDHGLRPASKQWASHCRKLARKLGVPLKVLTTKVERPPGASLEAAARDARYRVLADALRPGEVLLTAHHADDQLETVLLQLLRGSGLPGISAMPALASFANEFLARPLLSRSRTELETWVREQNLTWVEDDTNVDESLDRNYLRLRVLPLIRDRWPGSATAVSRSARHAAEAQSLLDALARADVDRSSYGESLSIKTLRALPPDRRRNALRFWITQSGHRAPDTRRLEELAGPLLDARPDANPFVTWGEAEEGVRAQRYADLLSLQPAPREPVSPRALKPTTLDASASHALSPPAAPSSRLTPATIASPRPDLAWSWHDSPTYELPHSCGTLELEPDPRGPLDLDALPHPLSIRWRRGGERLTPHRGAPRRALKNLLQESRVPITDRAQLPLLFSTTAEEKLLAVADLLLDETVQATPTSRRRARLRWKKSSH